MHKDKADWYRQRAIDAANGDNMDVHVGPDGRRMLAYNGAAG